MRILMLSWGYPPLVAGGHGRHAAVLARHLVDLGHEVHVVTRVEDHTPLGDDEWLDGVHVVRVPEAPPVIPLTDRVPAVLSFNSRAQAAAAKLIRRHDVDVLHVHDRLLTYAAAGLREAFGLPLVATIHATEHELHPGLPDEVSKLVHQVEWWLTYEARRVVTCTGQVRDQLRDHFRLPPDKLDVVPAAVEPPTPVADAGARASLAGPRTRIVLAAGRLAGDRLDDLLASLPAVRDAIGPTRLVVATAGLAPEEVRRRARRAGARHHVLAVGHQVGDALSRHAVLADVVVVLDDDEPCGATVLEAMAAGSAFVTTAAASSSEVVGDAGELVRRPTTARLADALTAALTDAGGAGRRRDAGRARIAERHAGPVVAATTLEVYRRAISEEWELSGREQRPPLRPLLRSAPILELDTTA
jgi:glycogen synthase